MFMHASWMHIIGNMVYLWAFGREIEDAMGGFRFLAFYLAGGIVAMMAQILGDPLSRVPALGASGAIAAVMGAFIVTYPRDRIKTVVFLLIFFRVTFIPAALLIGFWFLMQLFHVGMVAQVKTGGVAYLAHIGGFLFGVVTARIFEDPRRLARRRDSLLTTPLSRFWGTLLATREGCPSSGFSDLGHHETKFIRGSSRLLGPCFRSLI